jgi:hypothetical protein
MQSGLLKTLIVGFVLAGFVVPCAYGQLKVGDETELNLTGSASLGYNRVWDATTSDSVAYGFDAQLSGSYHDPRFLNYTVNPYLNQSNLNSTFNSNTLASGVNAQANFLSDSRTPVQFTYVRDYNRQGTFNVPGSLGNYITNGNGQSFSVNASYLPENWPSIQGTYVHAGTDYEVLGTPGTGRSHSDLFGLSSAYVLWDTNLSASYTKSWVNSESPAFGAPDQFITQNTAQDTFQVSASRKIFTKANLSGGYSRSHIFGEYSNTNVDSTFNSVYGDLAVTLTDRLTVAGHANYSSNLSGQYFSNIIGGTSGQKGVTTADGGAVGASSTGESLSYTSSYLSYGANASYRATHSLVLLGSIDHRVQGQYNGLPDFTSTISQIGATWTHTLWGGGFGAAYGFSYSWTPVYTYENSTTKPGTITATQTGTSSFMGNSATVSYGRAFGAWSANVAGSYGEGLTKLLVGYTQTNYGASGSISRNVKYWNMSLYASYSNSHVNSTTLADTMTESYGASFSHKNFGASASYGKSSGNALQVLGGIVPTPIPITGTPQDLLIQFYGESYGFGASWKPKRRLNISGTYTRAHYTTINPLAGPAPVNSQTEQYYVRTEYSFRQLFVYTGYSYVSQGYNTATSVPFNYNAFYVGVTRYFNFF